MPAYCTDGQLRRSWKNLSSDVEYDDLAELRERVMAEVDTGLACVYRVPFNPWLRVESVMTNDLTIGFTDVCFLAVGDTIGFYDTSIKKLGTTRTTVTAISGTTVSVAAAGAIAEDDEVAVITSGSLPSGATLTWPGPPREVQQIAVALVRYYAHLEQTDAEEPTDALVEQYGRALAWMERATLGLTNIIGGSARVPGYHSNEGYTPVFGQDEATSWGVDADLLDALATDRE